MIIYKLEILNSVHHVIIHGSTLSCICITLYVSFHMYNVYV